MADFFQRQDDARKRTRLLVFLFIVAVAVVIALNYVLMGFVTLWGNGVWAPSLTLSAGVAGAVIGMGSGFKMLQLSAGGSAVAKELGGRELDWNTRDPDEKRLL